ncbi:MAG: immunoglobulin domain-containing protein, partial [Bacteroidetes bacterium]
GGLTIVLTNGNGTVTDSLFYYDHSDFDPTAVSGGGTPGNALPTTEPFPFPSLFFGNNRFLDYWTFVEIGKDSIGSITLQVVDDCTPCGPTNTPVIVNATGGGTFCPGADVTLSAENSVPGLDSLNYTWTGPNGFTFTGRAPASDSFSVTLSNVQPAASGTYELSLSTDLGCTSLTAQVDVLVVENPAIANLSGGGSHCEGEATVLSATNSAVGTDSITYTWTGPNGFSFTGRADNDGPFQVTLSNLSPSMSGDYTLSLTNDSGCNATPQTLTLTVEPQPRIENITGASTLCEGGDLTLSATSSVTGTGSITYTWTGPNGFFFQGTSDEDGPFSTTLQNVAPNQTGTYVLSLQSAAGCVSPSDSVEVTVLQQLVISSITGAGAYCEGEDVLLSGFNSVGGVDSITYTWTGPNGFSFQSTTADIDGPFELMLPDITLAQSGTYSLSLSSQGGCTAGPQSVEVTVNERPVPGNLSGGGDVCAGEVVILSGANLSGVDPVIYTWTGPGGFSFTDTVAGGAPLDLPLGNVNTTHSGTWTLLLSSLEGCDALLPLSLELRVNDLPDILGLPLTVESCSADTLTLSATLVGDEPLSYTWSGPGGVLSSGTALSGEQVSVELVPPGHVPGPYTLEVMSALGCNSAEVVEWTIEPTPALQPGAGTGDPVCQNDDGALSFQNTEPGVGAFTYLCFTPDGNVLSGTGSGTQPVNVPLPNIQPSQGGTYVCIVTSDAGCTSDSLNLDVEVISSPLLVDLEILGNTCTGDTVTFTALNAAPNTGTVSYTWTGPAGTFSGTAPAAGPFPFV